MRDTKEEILHFWFEETEPQQWFQKNDNFDKSIRDCFLVTYNMACDGLCDGWNRNEEGCLALCILLDQFPRNMFRNTAQAFATDSKALLVTKYAISKGYDQLLPPVKRGFLYMPFEHSENRSDQKKSVDLFAVMKDEAPLSYDYALRHMEIIEKFGRFPHRNAALNRDNTQEEEEYIAQGDAGF